MATTNETGITSLPAAADYRNLSSGYRFVTRNSAGAAALTAAAAKPYGLMDDDRVPQGRQTRIKILNMHSKLKAEAGGTIAFNADVAVGSDGKLIAATGAGTFVVGKADEAGVAGQIVSFTPCQPYALTA